MYNNISDLLIQNNIKPSIQRCKILEYLLNNRVHPTIDMIFINLLPQIPTLSKTTVYSTLKLFEEHNLVQSITIDDEEIRYDIDISNHLHFKCNKCKKVYDIFEKNLKNNTPLPEGFTCNKIQTYLWGTCKDCN